MFEIEAAGTMESLRNYNKLETLSSKLRLAILKILRGQVFKEIPHVDAKLKLNCAGQLNGRQIVWMVRKRFQIEEEGQYYSSRDLMDMVLEKDNVPGYLIAWDALCLNVDLPPIEKEIVFSKQIERSLQLEVVFRDCMTGCVKQKEA